MASSGLWAHAQTLPQGGVAVHGTATTAYSGNKLTVNAGNGAGTQHSAINWNSFSIGAGHTVQINQATASSLSINRVITQTPSALFGSLLSNGKVVLVNQSGIAVGAGALVDTAGFTASTIGMTTADAIAGRLRFAGDGLSSNPGGALRVDGNIVSRGGDVVLIAANVEVAKTAVVEAQNGTVTLAAGRSVEITGRGLEGITLEIQAKDDQAINLGTLKGDAVGIFAGTLKHSGLAQAVTADLVGGKVVLRAKGDASVEGDGQIIASSSQAGVKGGQVDVLGERVSVAGRALIDVSGTAGGGRIRVGGGVQGKDTDVSNAQRTYFGAGATLKADATQQGDGGTVIVWADEQTRGHGTISAQGGQQGGDGGFVEVSGKHRLAFDARVNTFAPLGRTGTLLLDPDYIEVSLTGVNTSDLTEVDQFSDFLGSALVIAPATLNVNANVVLQANEDITIQDPISMSFAGRSFTAQAGGFLTVNASITTQGGVVNLTAGDAGSLTGPSEGALYVYAPIDTTGAGAVPPGANINLNAPTSDVGGNSIYLSAPLNAGASGVNLIGQQVTQVAGSTITASTLTANASSGTINLGQANNISLDVSLSSMNALTFNNVYGAVINFSGVSSSAGSVSITTAGGFASDSPMSSFSNMVLNAGNAITLGDDVTVGGTLSVTAAGNIANSTGVFSVNGGLATFNAGASGGIFLADQFHNFSTLALAGAGTVEVRDGSALQVTALTLNAANTRVDLQSAGLLTLPATTINTGVADLSLLSGTSLTTTGALSGRNIYLQSNGGSVNLNHDVAAGDLLSIASNGGGVNQGGASTVQVINGGGVATINAPGGSINLVGTGNNTINGTLNLSTPASATIQVGNPVSLGTVGVGVNLTVTTSNDSITQSGSTFTVGGLATFSAGVGDVLLGASSNDFNTAAVTAHHVTLVDNNDLAVSSLALSGVGNVYLQAGAGSGGALTVPSSAISTTAQVSLLSNSSSSLVTPSSITGSTILLANPNGDIELNDVAASGPIFVNAGLAVVRSAGVLSSAAGIHLSGTSIGSFGNEVLVDPGGSGTVALTASTGGIYAQQASGNFTLSNYTLNAAGSAQQVLLAGAAAPGSNMNLNATYSSDDDVFFVAPASGAVITAGGQIDAHQINIVATGAGGAVSTPGALYSAITEVKLMSLNGDVSVTGPLSAAASSVVLAAGGNVSGGGSVTTQGGALLVRANASGSNTFGSFSPSGFGAISLGAIDTSGANGVNGIIGANATGKDGGSVDLAVLDGSGSVSFASIDTHGGAGATLTDVGLGMAGGHAGAVYVATTLADLNLSGLSINATGGRGGDASSAGNAGGPGGNGGAVTIEAGGNLNIGGTIDTKAGDGGNAFLSGAAASGGSGGTSGDISLTATAISQLHFTGPTILHALGGMPGLDHTGAGGSFSSADVHLTGFGMSQAVGAAVQTEATTVHFTAGGGGLFLNEVGNLFGELDGTSNSNVIIRGAYGVGDNGFVVSGPNLLHLFGWTSTEPLRIQGPISASSIQLESSVVAVGGDSIVIKDHVVAAGDLSLTAAGNIFQDQSGGGSVISVGGLTTINAGGTVSLANIGGNSFNWVDVINAGYFQLEAFSSITLYGINAGPQILVNVGGNIDASGAVLTAASGAINLAAGAGINLGGATLVAAGDVDLSTQGGPLLATGANISGVAGHWRTYLSDYAGGGHQFGPFDPIVNADYRQVNGNFGMILGTGNGSLWTDTGGIAAGTLSGSALKTYDGATSISLNGVGLSGLLFGESNVNLAAYTGVLDDPNVGTAQNVTFTGPLSLDGLATTANGKPTYGYTLASASGYVGNVDPAPVTVASLNGTREYDGTAIVNAGIFNIQGLVNGETLTLSGAGSIPDKHVGVNKPVTLGSLLLGNGSGLASNYTLMGGTHFATITPRSTSTWSGGTGNWSDATKWDGGTAVPDGNNVLKVIIPSGAQVTFDSSVAGGANVQEIQSAGRVILASGQLNVNDLLQTYQYGQNGGLLSGAGRLTVDQTFAKTGGAISLGGAVDITQVGSDLIVGGIQAGNMLLNAPDGRIHQNGALQVGGVLGAHAGQEIILDNTGNQISAVQAFADSGNLELKNSVPINVLGLRAASGAVKLNNVGGIFISGPVRALNNDITLVANSPLVLAADADITAGGNVTLAATNQTSAGNMLLNGTVQSTGGNISLLAANDIVQNGQMAAAGGITAQAGGAISFGPLAISAGNPVSYTASGAAVPNPPASLGELVARNSGTNGFVADFIDRFEEALDARSEDETDDPIKKRKGNDLTVEGESCRP